MRFWLNKFTHFSNNVLIVFVITFFCCCSCYLSDNSIKECPIKHFLQVFGSEHSWEMLLMWQIERERAKSVRDWSERTFLWGRKKQRSNFQYFIVINLWIFFIVAIKTMTIIVRWLDNRYVLVLQWHLKHWQLPTHQCHFSTRHYHLQFHFCNTTIIDKKAHSHQFRVIENENH